MDTREYIKDLRSKFTEHGIAAYIVPSGDFHLVNYLKQTFMLGQFSTMGLTHRKDMLRFFIDLLSTSLFPTLVRLN